MVDKVTKVKLVKKGKPAKKRLFNAIKNAKVKQLKLSVDQKEQKLIKKNIKRYKLNLLRNRKIEYQLKNLNSKQTLSFYKKN